MLVAAKESSSSKPNTTHDHEAHKDKRKRGGRVKGEERDKRTKREETKRNETLGFMQVFCFLVFQEFMSALGQKKKEK